MEHGPQSKMVRNPKGGVGPPELLERRLVGGKTLIEFPGFGDRPRPNDATPGAIIVEAVLGADVARFRRRAERSIGLSSELMQHRQIVEREDDAERMRILTSCCEPFLGDFQAANWITQMPVAVADVPTAKHPRVDPVNLRMIAPAVFASFGQFLEPVVGGLKPAEMERNHTCKMIGLSQKIGIGASLRQLNHLFDEACGAVEVGAHLINVA